MYKLILFTLWIFLPAGLANGSPVVFARFNWFRFLDKPMDFGEKFRGKPILGPHKTWRGIIGAIVVSTICFLIQRHLYVTEHWAVTVSRTVNYSHLNPWIVGPAFGFGALAGDAIKSFFKRQIGIQSGRTWFPFDQVDYILGGLLAVYPFIRMSLLDYLTVLLVWFVMHLIVTWVGYLTSFRERPI